MNELIKICKILDIKPPKIIYSNDANLFPTNTTIAVAKINNNTIFLNKNFLPKTNFDEIFSIAHECRHIWQFKNNKLNFTKHLQNNDISKNIYNNQPEEIDAHAFACAYMVKIHNVKPLFLNFDEQTKNYIYKLSTEILATLK